ncbi:MAG: AMP-binding protein [Methylococcaceae bacterium]
MEDCDLWTAFCQIAEQHPHHPAIIRGDEQTTFGQWHRRSLDYANWLFAKTPIVGERVILWLEPSPQMAAALFGIWAVGAIPVLTDPKSTSSQLLHAIETTEPVLIFFSSQTAIPDDCEIVSSANVDFIPKVSKFSGDIKRPSSCQAASIVFTSGSTGLPKGVTQSHGNLYRGASTVASYLEIGQTDRILSPVPWSFDYGFIQLQLTAITGATHIIPQPQNPFGICTAIERYKPTVLAGVPSLFTYLLHDISPFKQTDLSSIRIITNTGGTIPSRVLNELLRLFKQAAFYLNYGLTESYRSTYLDPSLINQKQNSIGKPIPGVDIVIVRDNGTLAKAHEVGEIVHRGDYIFLGYWNNPEKTEVILRPDPASPEGGRLSLFTGDFGYQDNEGFLYFQGRRDHQLKVMGVRVSPDEVEQLIYQSELVGEIAIFGIKNELLGDEIWAAVVPIDPDIDVRLLLIKHAKRVMTLNMAPRNYLVLDTLPKTTSGKIHFEKLKHLAKNIE